MTATTAVPIRPAPTADRRKMKRFIKRLPLRASIGLLLFIEIYPLVWLLFGSFKTQSEFLNQPTWALPESLNFENYVAAWTTGNIDTYVLNSILATVPSLILIVALGVAAGFALEVMVWKGRNQVLLAFLVGIMVPGQMILLPLFTVFFRTGLSPGTLWPLVITYTAIGLPLTVFMMATYFRAIPREVFEASTLDGASVLRSFWSVGFPMVRNAVFTVALVQFFFIWNDLLIALTFTRQDLRTIQVGLLNFTGEFGATQYGPLFAAICINVFGTLVIYLFLNQRVMKGLTAGSVKG